MKLKSQLREAPLELLQQISEFWDICPGKEEIREDSKKLADYLYPRLQTQSNFKQAFDRLEVSERDLVYFLAVHGGELPQEEFRRRTGLHSRDDFKASLATLQERGFAWAETIKDETIRYKIVGVPEPFVRLIDLPPYWRNFLGYYLQSLSLDELKAIAKHGLDEKYEGRKKQVIVHFIRERLLDPQKLKAYLDGAGETKSELFRQVLQRNGACIWRNLLDEGVRKKFNHVKAEHLQHLVKQSGLIFLNHTSDNHYENLVMIPRDIKHTLQNGYRQDERTLQELSRGGESKGRAKKKTEAHPNIILDNTQNLVRDLAIFLGYAANHHLKVLNNGGVGRNDLKKIVPLLSHHKTIKYVSFLALFAMQKKLLIPVGNRWRTSKSAGDWFKDSFQCFGEVYKYWLGTNDWNEEFSEGDVLHVDSYPQNLISVTELRKLILRVLEKTPVETWIDFATFAESLLPQVAIEIPGRFDHAPREKHNRHLVYIMESVIAESLYWFGITTLGLTEMGLARELGCRDNEVLSTADWSHTLPPGLLSGENSGFWFKVSSSCHQTFAGNLLDPDRAFGSKKGSPAPHADESEYFTVQPNLEIITPPDLNLERFYRLLAFTSIKKVDVMTTLSLSVDTLREGMQHGLSGGDILRFLETSSRKPLPETVIQLIDDCSSRHGEIDIGLAGGYITAGDRIHIEELRSNSKISKYIKDVVEDKVIVLSRTVDIKAVSQEIQKMGFMVSVASDTLHVTSENLFHVTLRPDELHELLAILNFAQGLEETAEGKIFDDRLRPLLERLAGDSESEQNIDHYVQPLLHSFQKNYDKTISKTRDEEKKKLKKQVNRLLTRAPRRSESRKYSGENPTSSPKNVARLFKFAIENEMQVKIHYQRSTGDEIDEVIEPESMRGKRIYALCPEHDEHHIYVVDRIMEAAI